MDVHFTLDRRIHFRPGACLAFIIGLFPALPAEESLTLVRDGQPASAVVLAGKPTRSAQLAAKELQHHVRLITGSEIAIVHEGVKLDGRKPLYVGESEPARKLGLKGADFEEQEHLVRVTGEYAVMIGKDWPDYGMVSYEKSGGWPGISVGAPDFQVGTLYAVYDFLEALCGVRWYMVTDAGTVYPRAKTLTVKAAERRRKPWTTYRRIGNRGWTKPGTFGRPDGMGYVRNRNYGKARDSLLYTLRTRQNGSTFHFGTHTLRMYNQTHAEAHPDWFVGGKPGPSVQLRLWKDEVVEQVSNDIVEYFRRPYIERVKSDPAFPMGFGNVCKVAPLDNRTFGDDCKPPRQPNRKGGFADGQYSNYWFTFVNRVAKRVLETHPDKWISAPAYASHFEPPEFGLSPNVGVHVANTEGWKAGSYGIRNLKAWRERVSRLFVYEYWYSKGRFPAVRPHHLADYIRQLKDLKVEGWQMEFFGANPAAEHLDFYVATKMLFDADADADEILEEYFRLFYGPGQEPMKKFWEAVEREKTRSGGLKIRNRTRLWYEIGKTDFIKVIETHLRDAEKLAVEEPYSSRLRIIRSGLLGMMQQRVGVARSAYSPRKRIACPEVPSAPRIDGAIDEEAWQSAAATTPFVRSNSFEADARTVARLMRDKDYLYFAFFCKGISPAPEKSPRRRHDSPQILREDGIRIALDMNRTRSKYFLLAINMAGDIYDASVIAELGKTWRDSHEIRETSRNPKWESEAKAAISRGEDSWTLEVQIPLEQLGLYRIPQITAGALPDVFGDELEDDEEKPKEDQGGNRIRGGSVWGLNLARVHRNPASATKSPQTTMWSPTFTHFNFPNGFGVCETRQQTLGDKPVIHYDFEDYLQTMKKVKDRAGIEVDGKRQTSPGILKLARGGKRWREANSVEGVEGKAIKFGGKKAGQYLEVKLSPAVNLAKDDFTVSFWFKSKAPGGNLVACLVNTTGNYPHWYISFHQTGALISVLNTGFKNGIRGPGLAMRSKKGLEILSDGRWHHLVMMIDRGSSMRMFVDGELLALAGNKIRNVKAALPRVLFIGTYYGCVNGTIDEFKVFQGTFEGDWARELFQREGKSQ
ncbi:MAG: DUF4838 domain-containing protein [Planctomycetota bacterium]|nr:DUF4838 domain-containing protein [Planctomycetota bacterium]